MNKIQIAPTSLLMILVFSVQVVLFGQDNFESSISIPIKTYCLKCHSGDEHAESEVNLSHLDQDGFGQQLELARDVVNVLDFKEMPPSDAPQPSPELRRQLIHALKHRIESEVFDSADSRTPIRRMTRLQYNNAIVDLFDLKCAVFSLPEKAMRSYRNYFRPHTQKMPEVVYVGNRPLGKSQMIEPRLSGVAPFPKDLRAEHGFDTQADHLSLSPLLLESFLNLGQSIVTSPEFNAQKVGKWRAWFAEPKGEFGRKQIELRLQEMLSIAFRRPAGEEMVKRYADFVESKIESGLTVTAAMRKVAAAVISSPRFLYLYESNSSVAKGQYDLASQLAFFLWGSLPDQRLTNLAASGQLGQPEVLEKEVERMLLDPKVKRFCDSFPTQWLQLDRIVSSTPSREKFHSFYFQNGGKYRMSMHMMLEPLLLFETVLIENLPVTQLVDSDFTYRSQLLNNLYGELKLKPPSTPKKSGNVAMLAFVRMPVTDKRVGGVITTAATMTMTSGVERTKPITRGAWIASVVFNNPPEPPPADVPELNDQPAEGEEDLTLRERLSIHRTRKDCRGCHEKLDPLGFALENFDPIGRWRDTYSNQRTVDVEGQLFRQHKFQTLTEFKEAILKERERFTRGLAGHLLSFALSRPMQAADQPALDKIVEQTASDGYRMKTLIKSVITSRPFLRCATIEATSLPLKEVR